MYQPAANQRGFGLIEIMIALVLGIVLSLGIIQIFASSKQTSVTQNAAARLQEDARYALSRMTQELRMAGMFGCLSLSSASVAGVPASFNTPIEWSPGSTTLTIITSHATPGVEAPTAADWTMVTDCRTTATVHNGNTAPGAGEIALPIYQVEYRLNTTDNVLEVRRGGSGSFSPLIGNVQSLDVQFGLAASAELPFVSGNYVAGSAVPNPDLIRSVRVAMVLEDPDQRAAPQTYTVVAALRNRLP